MTEETVSTAYERLVQGRRTFGSKTEETIPNKENVEELPSMMVLEDPPKTSLWDDDGSFKAIASDDEQDEEEQVGRDNQVDAVDESSLHGTNDDIEDELFSEKKARDDIADDTTHERYGDDTDSKLVESQEERTDEDDEENTHHERIPASPLASEKGSHSSRSNSPEKLQEKDDDSMHDEPPSLESILETTNRVFEQVEDKGSVTVKQILERLGVPLDKATKKAVRQRLVDLITAWQKQQEDDNSDSDDSSKDSASERGDKVDDDDDAMDDEEEQVGEADDEYEPDAPKPRKARAKKTRALASERTRGLVGERTRRKKLNKSLQKSALRIKAEQLRKKRMQELRVRNEELQYESKDQERAEQIAAKFETQTDDQLRERLSNRVQLWQKLDKKRWNVLQAQPVIKVESAEIADEIKIEADPAEAEKEVPPNDVDLSDDSDSDDDLEITGATKSLMSVQNSPQKVRKDVLSLLELSSPKLAIHRKEPTISPNRSLASLKRQLRSKHQKMGNLWLAQELGYKTEQEHIQDCVQLEERKRQLQLAREQERLKESELRQERLLQLGIDYEEEDQLPESEESRENNGEEKSDNEDGEDEEIAMAREMGAIASESDPADETIQFGEDEVESNRIESTNDASDEKDSVPTNANVAMIKSNLLKNDGGIKLKNGIISEGRGPIHEENITTNNDEDDGPTTCEEDESNADTEAGVHDDSEDDGNAEIESEIPEPEKPKGPRNAAWKAMLQREEEKLKKLKKRGKGLVEEEAEEEEEEEVAGLEDFGFKIHKKKNGDEEDEDNLPDEDDEMDDVVDELSDNEGDEDAGEKARREEQKKEEKERHKEILRRMRDGYDGRRGGIAGGSARGIHRFDQLVAADNREDAKRLGLLNDDELDSEDEAEKKDSDDEEEDENALLDKMLKDRFLHRSSIEVEENFSGDEEDEEKDTGDGEDDAKQTEEEREQERLAKRFSKRARMQRLIDAHGHDEEFSRSKLIDDDEMIKADLQRMKNGLARKRSVSSTASRSISDASGGKKQKKGIFGDVFQAGGSLAIALQANRRIKSRTSYVRTGAVTSSETRIHQQSTSISFNHVVFRAATENSQSRSNLPSTTMKPVAGRKVTPPQVSKTGSSLWSKSVVAGFQKKR